jgi:hypothetical protein
MGQSLHDICIGWLPLHCLLLAFACARLTEPPLLLPIQDLVHRLTILTRSCTVRRQTLFITLCLAFLTNCKVFSCLRFPGWRHAGLVVLYTCAFREIGVSSVTSSGLCSLLGSFLRRILHQAAYAPPNTSDDDTKEDDYKNDHHYHGIPYHFGCSLAYALAFCNIPSQEEGDMVVVTKISVAVGDNSIGRRRRAHLG